MWTLGSCFGPRWDPSSEPVGGMEVRHWIGVLWFGRMVYASYRSCTKKYVCSWPGGVDLPRIDPSYETFRYFFTFPPVVGCVCGEAPAGWTGPRRGLRLGDFQCETDGMSLCGLAAVGIVYRSKMLGNSKKTGWVKGKMKKQLCGSQGFNFWPIATCFDMSLWSTPGSTPYVGPLRPMDATMIRWFTLWTWGISHATIWEISFFKVLPSSWIQWGLVRRAVWTFQKPSKDGYIPHLTSVLKKHPKQEERLASLRLLVAFATVPVWPVSPPDEELAAGIGAGGLARNPMSSWPKLVSVQFWMFWTFDSWTNYMYINRHKELY